MKRYVENIYGAPECPHCRSQGVITKMYLASTQVDLPTGKTYAIHKCSMFGHEEVQQWPIVKQPILPGAVWLGDCKNCSAWSEQIIVALLRDPYRLHAKCRGCNCTVSYDPSVFRQEFSHLRPPVLTPTQPAASTQNQAPAPGYPQHCGQDMSCVGLHNQNGEPIYQCDVCRLTGVKEKDFSFPVVQGSNPRFTPLPHGERPAWPGDTEGRFPTPEELLEWLKTLDDHQLTDALQSIIDDRAALKQVFTDVFILQKDPYDGDPL